MSELRERIRKRLKRLRNAEFGAGKEECDGGSARRQDGLLSTADSIEAEVLALLDDEITRLRAENEDLCEQLQETESRGWPASAYAAVSENELFRARVEGLEKIAEEITDSESWACTDSDYNTRCDWCDYKARGFDGEHEPHCIVSRARRALRGETDE